jgi:pimeloyl-ACP methyl ester carboxylesterase
LRNPGFASAGFIVFVVGVVSLFHRDLGGAGNPPLVVLHGLLGSSRNWLTTGGDLAEHYHVLAPDLRNHGRSPHADEMTYEAMAADVLAWMDAQHLKRVTLVGHSMGGKTAMLLACRHPERVERLVVVDIAPKDYVSHGHRFEFAAMNELRLDTLQSRGEAELRFEARVSDWAMRKFLVTNLERAETGGWKWQINLPVLTASLPVIEKNSLKDDDRFSGPTLFIKGGKSRYVQPEDSAIIERHFPGAQVEVIAGSGHNPHMETREEFVRAVLGA